MALMSESAATAEDVDTLVEDLRRLTEEANCKRAEARKIAAERRERMARLRDQHHWSFRRIGEVIGVSGQRVDSMLRLGDKLAMRQLTELDEAV